MNVDRELVGLAMNVPSAKDTIAFLWAWLPWIAGGVAGIVSFVTNIIQIWESRTFRKKLADWYNRRRARRILAARARLSELENESEF